MPVTNDDGEIIEYKIYQAVLIVRYSADGKLYLYDIQNIKKETRYPSWTNMSDGQKPASSEDNCNTDNKKSKANFMNQNNKNEVRTMENLTSKDKTGRILVEGEFKICNKPSHCLGSSCPKDCIINRLIERLYELEHKKDTGKKKIKPKGKQS